MDSHTYITFIGASIILCLVPGPDMLYLLGRSIANGRKAGMYAAFGINTGAYFHLVAAVIGLTTILAASSVAFSIIKWLGAAYLVYLGIATLKAKESRIAKVDSLSQVSNSVFFWQGFISDVLNPKVALFYMAVLPQFIDPNTHHATRDLLVLGVTLNVIGMMTNVMYVYFASSITKKLRESNRLTYWFNKALGSLFVALGLKLATENQ